MKKLFCTIMLAASALAFTSCLQEMEAPLMSEDGFIPVLLKTRPSLSKTTTTDGEHVLWQDTDRLGLADGAGHNYEFTPTFQGSVSDGSFEGTVASAGDYYAYYPHSATLSEGAPLVAVPASQTLQSNGVFDAAADVLVSKKLTVTGLSPTVHVAFKRLAGFLKIGFDNQSGISLSGETIASLTVSVDNGYLGGTVSLDLPNASLGDVLDGQGSITVTSPDGSLTPAGTAMVGVLPQTLPAGTQMTIEAVTEHYTLSKTVSLGSALTLSAGHVLPVNVKLADGDVTYRLPGGSDAYMLVTDVSELEDGDEIILVNEAGALALGTTQNTKNRKAESITVSDSQITEVPDNVQVITLVKNGTKWNLSVGNGYLSSAASNNQLVTNNSVNNYSTWTISIDGTTGAATITAGAGSSTIIRFNPNGNSPLFSCYASNSSIQNPVFIYRKGSVPADPVYVTQHSQLGLYLGSQTRTYTAGTDQYVRYYDGEDVTFVLMDPSTVEQLSISGFGTDSALGDPLTLDVEWRKGAQTLLSKQYHMTVLKVKEPFLWIGDAKGNGFIVKR